ncbi:MAG: hypothetical protein ACR2P5_09775 [Gammaproteobacteria bacterium]
MPFEATDWTITRATGDIRYIGDAHVGATPSYTQGIELHRALQDFADNETSAGDDELDITDLNPSIRQGTDNIIELPAPWNIDQTAAEHIYDASIIQNGGDDIWDAFQNFGPPATRIQIIQNGALIANDFWNSGTGLNPNITRGISHQFLVKVRTAGADIDGRRLVGISREFGKTFPEFVVNGTNRGNNTLALAPLDDNNNQTLEATVATWADVVNAEGYIGLDANNDSVNEFYFAELDNGSRSDNEVYERQKWVQREGTSETLYGLPADIFRGITHQIDIDNPTGTFQEPEGVTWAGGQGQLLAIDSTTAGTQMWIQLITGSAPVDNDAITGVISGATADVNLNVVSRNLPYPNPWIGGSTGSDILGAYGVGRQIADLSAADQLTDLGNNAISPPNFVTFNFNGLIVGESRVFIGPWDGVALDVQGNPELDDDQMTLANAQAGSATTTLQMAALIPTDTPSSGSIRVVLDSGRRLKVDYASYTGDTFTITSTDFSGGNSAAAGNGVSVAYIDILATATTQSFTSVFLANRNLVAKMRDGAGTPTKEFISSAVLTSAGGSITAQQQSDA